LLSADSTHISPPSAFADVTDNANVAFEGMAHAMEKAGVNVGEQAGTIRQVWNGLLDDILGSKAAKK
jgi:hypothetical protein